MSAVDVIRYFGAVDLRYNTVRARTAIKERTNHHHRQKYGFKSSFRSISSAADESELVKSLINC